MNIKKILISEIEKRDILRQYSILTEEAPPISQLNIDKNVNFPSGYYKEKYLIKDLTPEITKIRDYLTAGSGKAFMVSVSISSGESQIPNSDNEKKPPVRVEPLVLSTNRMGSIKNYITTQLQSFVDSKLLISIPNFNVATPVVGKTAWIGQPFCPKNLIPANDTQGYICSKPTFNPGKDASGKQIVNWATGKKTIYKTIYDSYLSEQFINVKIVLKDVSETKKCLDNMTIDINYISGGAVAHRCNSALYKIFIKGNLNKTGYGTLLLRNDGKDYASLNNDYTTQDMKNYPKLGEYDNNPTSLGGSRYNKFVITSEIASTLISDGSTSFIISAQCINPTNYNDKTWKNGCHDGVGNILVTNGNGEKIPYKDIRTPKGLNQVVTLLPINACGKKPS